MSIVLRASPIRGPIEKLHDFVASLRAALKLSTPEEGSRVYMFNKHHLKHRFCPTCGIHPYAEGRSPNGDEMAAINIRCLEGVDLSSIPVTHFDGRSK